MSTVLGLLARHALSFLGGYLMTKGLSEVDASTVISAGSTLAAIAWSYYQKRKAKA